VAASIIYLIAMIFAILGGSYYRQLKSLLNLQKTQRRLEEALRRLAVATSDRRSVTQSSERKKQ
jgi:hypothetical protein